MHQRSFHPKLLVPSPGIMLILHPSSLAKNSFFCWDTHIFDSSNKLLKRFTWPKASLFGWIYCLLVNDVKGPDLFHQTKKRSISEKKHGEVYSQYIFFGSTRHPVTVTTRMTLHFYEGIPSWTFVCHDCMLGCRSNILTQKLTWNLKMFAWKRKRITNFWLPNRPNLSNNQQFRYVSHGIQSLQPPIFGFHINSWWHIPYPIGFFRKSSSKTVPKTVEIKRSGEGKHPHLKRRNKRRGYVFLLARFNDTMNMANVTNMMGISIEIVLSYYFEASSWNIKGVV